jgi:hypothetical protein
MKTAVSVPDEVFERAERAAKRLGLSRSELFTRAIVSFLSTRTDESITNSYDAAFGESADSDVDADALRRKATQRALLAVEWE